MKKILAFFDGKKSYIGGAILFLSGGLLAIKVIDQQTFEILAAIAGTITVYGVRDAIKKLE